MQTTLLSFVVPIELKLILQFYLYESPILFTSQEHLAICKPLSNRVKKLYLLFTDRVGFEL